jgi:capsular exopolysaccharide synthesis family protein
MEPREYLQVFKRRWRLLAACVLVAGVMAWITTPAHPSDDAVEFSATHELIRDSTATAPPALASLAIFVKTGEVPRRVAERVGYDGEPAVLGGRVTLEPDEVVGTLGITVTSGTPARAAELANAFAEETLSYLGEQAQAAQQDQLGRLNEQLATLQVEIDALDDEMAAAETAGTSTGVLEAERDSKLRQYGAALDQQQQVVNQAAPSAGYVTLQEALPDLATVVSGGFSAPKSRPARTGIAVVLGLLLGLVAVLVAERLDTRLNTREAVQVAFRLPVIAEVPRVTGARFAVVAADDPLSSAAEAYRTLRASLVLMPNSSLGGRSVNEVGEPQVILVTSPAPGDGKTTTVANLAACFAEAGREVLVLGCDFRRPEVHQYFGADPRPGIADVLMDSRRSLSSVVRPTSIPRVRIAASGTSLRSFGDVANAGRALVAEARELADVVIIDTPPILATNDATELIPAVDAVVMVARIGRTTADGGRRAHTLLDRLAAPAAGVVVNGTQAAETAYSSYYHSKAPAPPKRTVWPRRRLRAEEINDRIEPWHGARERPSDPSPASSLVAGPDGGSEPRAAHSDEDGGPRSASAAIGAVERRPEIDRP